MCVSPADIPVDHPDDPKPQPPPEPAPGECCGNGCDPCIYDIYGDELQRYRAALAAWRARHPDEA